MLPKNNKDDEKKESKMTLSKKKKCKCLYCKDVDAGGKILRNSKGKRLHKCQYKDCGKVYQNAAHLVIHFRSHTGERPFVCQEPNCKLSFYQNSNLKYHLRMHTGEIKPNKFNCDNCDYACNALQGMERHQISHLRQGKNYVFFKRNKCQCPNCQAEKAGGKKLLNDKGRRLHNCHYENCDKIYDTASSLRYHVMTHLGRRFACKFCDKTYTRKSALTDHEYTHSKFLCNICNYRSSKKRNLSEHMETHLINQNDTGASPNNSKKDNVKLKKVDESLDDSQTLLNESEEKKNHTVGTCQLNLQDLDKWWPKDSDIVEEEDDEDVDVELETHDIKIEPKQEPSYPNL